MKLPHFTLCITEKKWANFTCKSAEQLLVNYVEVKRLQRSSKSIPTQN